MCGEKEVVILAIKSVLAKQEDFTGEFQVTEQTAAMWRFNEAAPDSETALADCSGKNRRLIISGWGGNATAALLNSRYGRYFRLNIVSPDTEKTHLIAENDGGFFSELGERIVVGGWINPTTYSVGQNFIPLFNTRQGPGQPIFYVSLYQGRPRMMIYNSAGALILDQSETPPFSTVNNGWYFIGAVIGVTAKTSQMILCNRADGMVWKAPIRTVSGDINPSCTANIIMGMLADQYYYAGGFDDWFFETDSQLTIDDLERYFRQAMLANGADSTASVDALTEPGAVLLRKTDNVYAESGVLETTAAVCALSGSGRVSVTSEYTAGITAVALIETSTSDNMTDWSSWQTVGVNGELVSPNKEYIRYRVTLTTSDTNASPKLLNIQLHDIPKPPYERLGFARPMVLDKNGAWESVLENAYDIIVTGEVNGADILEFKLPYLDAKRTSLDNEKSIQIVNDIYRIRTVTDDKNNNEATTSVYAESVFYDLAFSEEIQPMTFSNSFPGEPLRYALRGTDWLAGTVNITARRTWQLQEKNALASLRKIQEIYGGDLVFDNPNRLVHLLTFSGKESGALFAYRKNLTGIQRVTDTRGLVTRLYARGTEGLTFALINGGKPYVEDFTYCSEVRVSSLDLSNFSNPYDMLEFTKMRLAEYAIPRVSYVLSAMDLSVLTGYEHERWELGDIVMVDDRDLNLKIKTRIVRRQYNLQEPWKTVLELSTKLREFGDVSAQWDKTADQLMNFENVQSSSKQEVRDFVPFNHLRNSRGDDGFAYWLNSGFEIDTQNGVTGTASFKAAGFQGAKYMEQTVYPDSRRSYTISAQLGGENLVKGENGRVGIEVVFEYEDGTTENKFIDFFSVDSAYVVENDIKQVVVSGGIPEAPNNGKIYGRQDTSWVEVTGGGQGGGWDGTVDVTEDIVAFTSSSWTAQVADVINETVVSASASLPLTAKFIETLPMFASESWNAQTAALSDVTPNAQATLYYIDNLHIRLAFSNPVYGGTQSLSAFTVRGVFGGQFIQRSPAAIVRSSTNGYDLTLDSDMDLNMVLLGDAIFLQYNSNVGNLRSNISGELLPDILTQLIKG